MKIASILLCILIQYCVQAITLPDVPLVIPASIWKQSQDSGYICEGIRKNIRPGDSFVTDGLILRVVKVDQENALLRLTKNGVIDCRTAAAMTAFNWGGYHISVLAVSSSLVEFEICRADEVPLEVLDLKSAGYAGQRARILHEIERITLHHCGDAKPMAFNENPFKKLRNLRTWGLRDKNWWDVPYHFLITPTGIIIEGRDYHFMGETSTLYNPKGHLLISAMGNYDIQKPTPETLQAIIDLIVWAVVRFNVPLDQIKGHLDYTKDTTCPGDNLYPYLKDGTILKGVKKKLGLSD
ncbi:MAG: peptidoglycan recognition family protein [Candidatus Wallbacteria bacterium]|nr:peptidoglycan recognition family protein [Candidatus Wallbacteria bacterium]